MATQQLSAKREILSEQVASAGAHLESLMIKSDLVSGHSARLCDLVSSKFTMLKQTLEKKEQELLSKIHRDSSRVKGDLELAITSAKLIIDKSMMVRYCMCF